ncbi:MAG: hypothetical protein GXZ05_12005 [Gammaproteobacteria bacterium]|nr:hypothetical protein [Gammaproteobacteria bacterium]
MFKQLKKTAGAVALAASSLAVMSAPAHASWDYSSVTSGIDFASIATGVLAVAALLGAVYAGIKGARIILGFLRS